MSANSVRPVIEGVKARLTESGAYEDAAFGHEAAERLPYLTAAGFAEAISRLLVRGNLTVSLAGPEPSQSCIDNFAAMLPCTAGLRAHRLMPLDPEPLGTIITDARAVHAAIGFVPERMDGGWEVMARTIGSRYLAPLLCGSLGAYDVGCLCEDGVFILWVMDAPDASRAFEAFGGAAGFAERLRLSPEALDRYRVSAINTLSRPLHAADQLNVSLRGFFTGVTPEAISCKYNEVLAAPEPCFYAGALGDGLSHACRCASGARDLLAVTHI
jgi:hypothetical protein